MLEPTPICNACVHIPLALESVAQSDIGIPQRIHRMGPKLECTAVIGLYEMSAQFEMVTVILALFVHAVPSLSLDQFGPCFHTRICLRA